jgi:hypothetical protein
MIEPFENRVWRILLLLALIAVLLMDLLVWRPN